MRSHRAAVSTLLVAAAALAAVWALAPRSAPPLYDGLTLPNAPYRYLNPPSCVQNPGAPGSFNQGFAISGGTAPTIAEGTGESPPQAQFLVGPDAFVLPAGAASITVTITPVAAPAQQPAGGQINGNVYRFDVSAGSTALQLKPQALATVVLRGPANVSGVDLEQFTGTQWTKLTTTPIGSPDTYGANVSALGDAALVSTGSPCGSSGPPGASQPGAAQSGASGGSTGIVIGIVAGAVVVATAAIIGIRAGRTRSGAAAAQRGRRGPTPRGPSQRGPRPPGRRR